MQMNLRSLLRTWLVVACALWLTACGYQLRQAPDFAFTSFYSTAPRTSMLVEELKRNLVATGKVRVLTEAREMATAQVVLDVLTDQREKVVVGINAAGQVTEFQLRLRLRFKLRTPQGKELIPETEILQQREISFSESAVLAKEGEEQLLYRDMQSDIVLQLMRRLAAVRQID